MGVMKKHQRVGRSRVAPRRSGSIVAKNQELAQQVTRANPRRDRAQSRTRQPPAAAPVPVKRQDRYTLSICCCWDTHPADHGTDDESHRWVPVEP